MATQHSIETLRARVEALGHKLVTNPGLIEEPTSDEDREYTGLYILEPKTDRLVIVTTGDAEGDAHEVAGWCDNRECEAPLIGGATADDFNSRTAAREYERFISLLVLAKMRDRMHANKLRTNQGVGEAIRYLEDCYVEQPDGGALAPGLMRALQTVAVVRRDVHDSDAIAALDKLRNEIEQLAGPASAAYAENRDERVVTLSNKLHGEAAVLTERATALAGLLSDTEQLQRHGSIEVSQEESQQGQALLASLADAIKRLDEIIMSAEERP